MDIVLAKIGVVVWVGVMLAYLIRTIKNELWK